MSPKRVPLNAAIERDFLNSDLNVHKTESNLLDDLPTEEVKERTVRITVDLPVSLHNKLKIFCATKNIKINKLVIYLIERILASP